MRWNSFGRSLAFAAVAAACSPAWLLALAPIAGWRRALGAWLVCVTTAYLAGLGHTVRRRVAAGVAGAAVALALFAVAPGPRDLALGLAVLLAVARSVFLHRTTAARAAVTEAALVVGGLLFAGASGGSSLGGVALGTWAFFLVQSLFFLVPGRQPRSDGPRPDAFQAAVARASALLDAP